MRGSIFLAWTKKEVDSLGGCAIMRCRQSAKQNENKRNCNLLSIWCRSRCLIAGLLHLTHPNDMTLQALTRVQRSLIRAGNPYIPLGGVEQLRQSHRGEALRTYADGRYFLMSARAGQKTSADSLRIHLRQRVYSYPSKWVRVIAPVGAGNCRKRQPARKNDDSGF